MDVNKIKTFLPHRYPFLFVDKIMSLTNKEIVGIKNLSNDEYFFEGHYPERPVMPEVLQLEAMIQTGTILILNAISNASNYYVEFSQIYDAKFNRNVVPGDVLVIKISFCGPIENENVCLIGRAFVGTELVCEAEMNAKIVNQKK